MDADGDKPDWWVKNERARESMDLPSYDPPRFDDGEYVHEVVADLEDDHECEITLIGINVDHTDDWEVRVDDDAAFTVGRSRTDDGNTVYHVDADTFRERVSNAVS